ncbi:hypothetical protein RclHR1_09790007 [Rhizophagus clarus]|uniref:Uncharacterized protein n=1 Tax=Rhizophagus clarus TaxID=94130 RepID=A0A2Z6SJ68_9GLOM|nr:hypothetical protein RclHR1_09790007 [Rhizophagus clarus]GES85582.1 hypothetical protein RCL_jg6586.t1 [Rhizophagus clarus]
MLSDGEWKLMQQLTKLLQSFYDVTKLFSGEKYATVSFIYYVVVSLQVKAIPKEIQMVDLMTRAFDDVEFEDGNDVIVVTSVNKSQKKKKKIKIQNPLKCKGKAEELHHLLLHYW